MLARADDSGGRPCRRGGVARPLLRCPGRVIVEALKLGGRFRRRRRELRRSAPSSSRRKVACRESSSVNPDGRATAEVRARRSSSTRPGRGQVSSPPKWGACRTTRGAARRRLECPARSARAIGPHGGFAGPVDRRLRVAVCELARRPLVRWHRRCAARRARCAAAETVAEHELQAFLAAVNRCVPRLEATSPRRPACLQWCPSRGRREAPYVPRARNLCVAACRGAYSRSPARNSHGPQRGTPGALGIVRRSGNPAMAATRRRRIRRVTPAPPTACSATNGLCPIPSVSRARTLRTPEA